MKLGYNEQLKTSHFCSLQQGFVITGLICVLNWPISLKNPFVITGCLLTTELVINEFHCNLVPSPGHFLKPNSTLQQFLTIFLFLGLKLAHPLMPFITEELFQRIGAKQKSSTVSSIMLQKYPTNDEVSWPKIYCFFSPQSCLRKRKNHMTRNGYRKFLLWSWYNTRCCVRPQII